MDPDRFFRNVGLFGEAGQARLRCSRVAVVGVGGLGTHVIQQLSLLGVGGLTLVDDEELDRTNLNRYVGARYDDSIPGTPKVDLGERITASVDPEIPVRKVHRSFITAEGFSALKEVDCVFGCLDDDGPRLVLTEFTAAYAKHYVDLATDVSPGKTLAFGGRVVVSWDGAGCPVCLGAINLAEAQRELASPEMRRDLDAIYGVGTEHLGGSGPAVVSLNGVVASLGVTEFMAATTGLRAPARLLNYYGQRGIVTISRDPVPADCYYCKVIRGRREEAEVERFLPKEDREPLEGPASLL